MTSTTSAIDVVAQALDESISEFVELRHAGDPAASPREAARVAVEALTADGLLSTRLNAADDLATLRRQLWDIYGRRPDIYYDDVLLVETVRQDLARLRALTERRGAGMTVWRVGAKDPTIVREQRGPQADHRHVDEGGDPSIGMFKRAEDAERAVAAVNGTQPATQAELDEMTGACEQRITGLQAEFQRTDQVRNRQLGQARTELERVRTELTEHWYRDRDEMLRLRAQRDAAIAIADQWKRDADADLAPSALDAAAGQLRKTLGAACCDLHGRTCEPPSELCCRGCTEGAHPQHADGSTCSNPDLSHVQHAEPR